MDKLFLFFLGQIVLQGTAADTIYNISEFEGNY